MAGVVSVTSSDAPSTAADSNKNYTAPLAVLTTLFFMWGFLTCMNDIIIPHLKAVFDLSYTKAMMVQFAFFAAYFVMSMPAGAIVKRLGYKAGIIIGLIVASLGCSMFYPAAGARSYELFLTALFVLASGITLLQVAANPFVAVLGKPETASSRLTLTQAFNSLGTTLAPMFGSALILSTAVKSKGELAAMTPAELDAYRVAEAGSVQTPYLGLAAALVALAIAIALFKLPRIGSGDSAPTASRVTSKEDSAWNHRHLVLGAIGIFLYVGGEVAIGSFLVDFMAEPTIGGITKQHAGDLLAYYWGGAMIGRFIGTIVLRKFNPGRVLAVHALGAIALLTLGMTATGPVAMYAMLAIGLFNSIMFPTIFTLAIHGLGKQTGQGSGILCMAIVGGALVPVLQGAVADAIGIHHCFIVAAVCYAYIAWYGAKGSKPALAEKPAVAMAA